MKAKAQRRLGQAADALVQRLLGFALDGQVADPVALAAIRDALDRAGLGAKTEVALELRPYEHILNDVAGVAQISRAESRARRGLPDDTPALDDEPLEVVDAELVDDDPELPEMGPTVDARRRTLAEPPDLPADDSAPATGPPGRELATLEDAAADADAANRRAKVGRVRRVRR